MASISKLQAALASVTNEITLAAANINFDFTLVKYEAPKEFHQLGNSLSKIRIDNAECGPIHMTARRLGALFDGMLPSTPSLLKAYGSRASAIALAAKDTITPEPENSMFAAYGGVDGTSIWAAATSSRSALHVQLLACMLARVWPASEATSVWYELVKERRRDIEQKWKDDEALPFASLTAAVQSDISRANLAEWDASARAWLRTADRVKTKEQDQLMLFIANLNVPININQEMGVYDSVVTAWISALESVDKLVSGTPQAVNSGACLLALSSWHLYPDILMASPTSTSHQFDDPFVKPGGTLTLGLASPGGGSARAAFWSLPLAHLSYYGRPIRREAELDMQSKAITFEQFTCVVFGALLSQWGFQNHQAEIPARFFASLRSSIDRANNITVTPDELYSVNNDDVTMVDEDSDSIGSSSTQTSVPDSPAVEGLHHGLHPSRALKILCRLSLQYLDAHEDRQDPIHKLINLGTKKASKFASNFDSPPTFFELESPTVTLRALRGANERISFLRRIASSAVLPREAYYVRYFVEREQSSLRTLDWRQDRDCGITTAFDETDFTFAHGQASVPRNFRWAPANWHDHGRLTNGETLHPMPLMISRELAAKEKFFTVAEASGGRQTYVLVYGNPNSAALFVNISYIQTPGSQAQQASLPLEIPETIPKVNSLLRGINLEDLIWCLDNDMFQLSSLIQHMDFFGPSSPPQVQLLFCLSAAQCIYGALPNANLTTRALNRPLHLTMWGSQQLQESWKNASTKVQAATAFACVAYMETGMDIDPVHFSRVFAIAYEDSIYVSMQLSCDPWESPEPYELRRITGNIGKPGLTLLIPPIDPIISARDESAWRLVSDNPFNGLPENAFSTTSMHLNFTDYYRPLVQSGTLQGQDNQVFFQESVVSVHNSGEWIGDVDVLGCLRSLLLSRQLEAKCNGNHHQLEPRSRRTGHIASIESWDDILDPPQSDMVVRAHGSWIARLATTLIFIQLQKSLSTEKAQKTLGGVLLFPKYSCWECLCAHVFETGLFGLNDHRLGDSANNGPRLLTVVIF